MPLEKLSDSTSGGSGTADALDSRLRRLEEILASTARSPGASVGEARFPEAPAGHVMDAATAALEELSAVAPRLSGLIRAIEARVGASSWDAADQLVARVLLDELVLALRSSRLVANSTSARLNDVSDTVKKDRRQLTHELRSTTHKARPVDVSREQE